MSESHPRRSSTGRPSPDQRRRARRDLGWMLLFLAGLLVPLGVGLVVVSTGMATPWRLAAIIAGIVVADGPLVSAGVAGRGAHGVVQPWRWNAYLAWLVIRLAMLLPIGLVA